VERDAERPRRGFAIVPGGGGRAGERAAGSVALGLGFRAGRGGEGGGGIRRVCFGDK
jgi:hypothetical protein